MTSLFKSWPVDWVDRVVGRSYVTRRSLRMFEAMALLTASEMDAEYLSYIRAQAQAVKDDLARKASAEHAAEKAHTAELARVQAAAEAELMDWNGLRERLPVPVYVGHNWTVAHNEVFSAGLDHIVVQEPVVAGRLHRSPLEALCETNSKRATGHLKHLDRRWNDSFTDAYRDRVPTCLGCLRVAEKLAA